MRPYVPKGRGDAAFVDVVATAGAAALLAAAAAAAAAGVCLL